jgi:hypothetical protein
MYTLSIVKNHWGWSIKGIYNWVSKSWGLPYQKDKLYRGVKTLFVFKLGPFQLSQTAKPCTYYEISSDKNGFLSKQKTIMACISWINEYTNRSNYTHEQFSIEEMHFDKDGNVKQITCIKYTPAEK